MSKKKPAGPGERILERALTFPGAWEDHPWGDTAIKVGKKIFVIFGETMVTLKMTEAHEAALSVPGAAPTGYGLGKAGWVTIPLDAAVPPLEIWYDWLEESYRAIAPKSLLCGSIRTGEDKTLDFQGMTRWLLAGLLMFGLLAPVRPGSAAPASAVATYPDWPMWRQAQPRRKTASSWPRCPVSALVGCGDTGKRKPMPPRCSSPKWTRAASR